MTSHAPPSRPAPPPPVKPSRHHYPHIDDLIARTNGLKPSDKASVRTNQSPPTGAPGADQPDQIKSWLHQATEHWKQAEWGLTFKKIDNAYVDYLLAFEIVASIIPKCTEYPTFKSSNTPARREYDQLRESIKRSFTDFQAIKEDIIRDNQASGVQSTEQQLAAEIKQSTEARESINGTTLRRSNALRPETRSKPDHLRSKFPTGHERSYSVFAGSPPTNEASKSSMDLTQRFNKLTLEKSPSLSQAAQFQSIHTDNERPVPRGPREMPNKLPPLNVQFLPQIPAPTYSPETSYVPGGISPPRSSRNSISIQRNDQPIPNGHKDTNSNTGVVTVEELFSYLKATSGIQVLLLDVRSREEFDQGHIFGRSVVCIEPIAVREGMSAADLEDTFIVTTGPEERLFKQRDSFDLVVYYDQSTTTNSFLHLAAANDQQVCLRRLHLALWDYAFNKRLKKPPCLLAGGLDAWVNYLGAHSLKTTTTSVNNPSSIRRSIPPGRSMTPQNLNSSSLGANGVGSPQWRSGNHHKVPHSPINIEEEQKWLEELQRESDPRTMTVPLSPNTQVDDKTQRRGTTMVATNGTVSYSRTLEEFFQKYPANPRESEFMTPSSPDRNTIIDHPFHVFSDVRSPGIQAPAPPSRPPPAVPRTSYSGVSERPGPATPPPLPVASIGQSHFGLSQPSLASSFGGGSIGKTGLKNLGNTCYMNSIVQCLSGTVPLARLFLNGDYRAQINKENPMGSRGLLAETFAVTIRHLWSGDYKFISPVTLKGVSGRLNETFKTNSQQDAQEYLEFLLDGLHEDLNPNANRTKLVPLTDEEERKRESLPIQTAARHEWARYTHTNHSVIVNWLQGQLASKLRCLTCNITSTTYTPFLSLTIPIPHTNQRFHLADCLQEFTKEEILDGDDAWNCPHCKCRRKATKTLTIMRLPPILIIHLKRFANRGKLGDKLNTLIEFPLQHLDLTKYVPPPLPEQDPTKIPDPQTTPPFVYDLYGVVNHYGTLSGGHYISYVKDSYKDHWCSFDDSKATIMDEGMVVSRNAYVLFWVRKGLN
ncbi:cysteine proteinase [Ascodesmis nigricans]|uniref:ubiquitinyl hydrolase 1 n=1 Tax=Ascodesmis nigricans TaxID=341454 RepID=A0A4S2MSZ1_9PEZI|nr:cysteine proteinase [Ascodesmis nigricans]